MKIISAIFRLEISKGHLKWSVAELSRKSGVSRSTIYLYLGESKSQILEAAVTAVCNEYYGLSPERMQLAKSDFLESARYTRRLSEQTPEFAVFYQVWRAKESVYRNLLMGFENQYRKKLKGLLPTLDDEAIVLLHTCLHGLVTAPFLNDADFVQCLKNLFKSLAIAPKRTNS